ncbi:MAG: hypothetical protein IKF71_01100 [Bacilli bacterium]|nr:hypothetical protein [Bacilli bacterium]
MEDTDLKELSRNLIIWLVVVVVFGSLMTIIFINKFGSKDIPINKIIDKKESLVVLIINNETKNTEQIQKKLEEYPLEYEVVNKDKERYYNEFLKKISITEEDIVEPTVLIIQKKKVKSILVDIENIEDLNTFLDYNK